MVKEKERAVSGFDVWVGAVPKEIVDAEKRAQESKLEMEAANRAAKQARQGYDDAVEFLHKVIRDASDPDLFIRLNEPDNE